MADQFIRIEPSLEKNTIVYFAIKKVKIGYCYFGDHGAASSLQFNFIKDLAIDQNRGIVLCEKRKEKQAKKTKHE